MQAIIVQIIPRLNTSHQCMILSWLVIGDDVNGIAEGGLPRSRRHTLAHLSSSVMANTQVREQEQIDDTML